MYGDYDSDENRLSDKWIIEKAEIVNLREEKEK